MESNDLRWTELLILILVIVVGVPAFFFYYVGMVTGYREAPLMAMQMLSIVTQLVILSVVYKIYLLAKDYVKPKKK